MPHDPGHERRADPRSALTPGALALKLEADFFARDPVVVARELLGAELRRRHGDGLLALRLVEVEAYDCPRDPACTAGRFHAARSAALSAPPGVWVFWRTHGHALLQVSCRAEGVAASVLLRAGEPLAGLAAMRAFRPTGRDRDLTNGPAKLVQALGIRPAAVQGRTVGGDLSLHWAGPLPDAAVQAGPRVGVRAGRELPWRFVVRGSPWLTPTVADPG